MRKSTFLGVRYIRISKTSLELLDTMSNNDKAFFLDQVFIWFQALEKGEQISLVDTGNKLLNIILDHEIRELQDGFDSYMQKVTNHPPKEDDNTDTSSIPQRTSNDTPPTHLIEEKKGDEKKKESEYIIGEEIVKGGTQIPPDKILLLEYELNNAGIIPDNGFWNTANKYGFHATYKAIDDVKKQQITSLSYLTKRIKEIAQPI